MLCKTKKRFFGKLDYRVISDNRRFWKTVGPLFSETTFHKESIILSNNKTTISNDEELAEIFSKHFSKLLENLDIDKNLAGSIASSDITDPAFNVIKKYDYHPTLKKIKHFVSGKDLQFWLNKK